MSVLQAIGGAMLPHIQRHSAILWIRPRSGELFAGSATCIGVGGRYFLATARHNIADLRSKHQVLVTPADGHFKREDYLSAEQFCLFEKPLADVAWIEIDPAAAQAKGVEGLALERLAPGVGLPLGQLYIAAGVPAGTHELRARRNGTFVVDLRFRTFLTQPHEDSEEGDMRFEYSDKMITSEGQVTSNYPPHGMSGGGLWSVTHEQPEIWVPDRCRLLGLISSYDPREKFIRCVRIGEWLRLLVESVPEVADEVREIAAKM